MGSVDEFVRDMVARHTDKEMGAPIWIKRMEKLNLKLDDIQTVEDLSHFDITSPDEIRDASIEALIPKILYKERVTNPDRKNKTTIETGGREGPAKTTPVTVGTWNSILKFVNDALDEHGVPYGINWATVLPDGPHPVGDLGKELAVYRDGWPFMTDFDPRWARQLMAEGRMDEFQKYTQHLRKQMEYIMRRQKVEGIFTSSTMLEKMLPQLQMMNEKGLLKAIMHGGTYMSPDTNKKLLELGVPVIGMYGESMLGVSMQTKTGKPDIDYYSQQPRLIGRVVKGPEENEWTETVKYMERGRVLYHRLDPEIMILNVLETDEATRIEPHGIYKWDGFRNPKSLESMKVRGAY
jgi:hypothetical protein